MLLVVTLSCCCWWSMNAQLGLCFHVCCWWISGLSRDFCASVWPMLVLEWNNYMYCHTFYAIWYGLAIITGRMPRSGKLPVLNLLTGQKSGFSPRRGDSLHQFRSNFAGLTGNWVRLAVQNFTSIAPGGWECGPKNIKNFHFLVKSRPVGATPLTDFQNF